MEDAQARKARLRALRDAAKDKEEPEEQATVAEPALKFRNYNVKDKKIDHVQLEAAQPPKFEAPDADEVVMDDTGATEDVLVSVAPKKPNWDLRRDVEKKLQKLERRTQRAMVQLVQEAEKARLENGVEA